MYVVCVGFVGGVSMPCEPPSPRARSIIIHDEGFGFSYFRKRLFFGLFCAFGCVTYNLVSEPSKVFAVGEPSLPVVGLGGSERNERSAGAGMAGGGA